MEVNEDFPVQAYPHSNCIRLRDVRRARRGRGVACYSGGQQMPAPRRKRISTRSRCRTETYSSISSRSNSDCVDVTVHHTHHTYHIPRHSILEELTTHMTCQTTKQRTRSRSPRNQQQQETIISSRGCSGQYVFLVYQVLTKNEYTRSRNGFVLQFCYQPNSQGTQTSSQRNLTS